MAGENKFFFEEDPAAQIGSGVSAKEQADLFGAVVAEAGIISTLDSMEPVQVLATPMAVKKRESTLLLIEYGTVGEDYVLHITPTHPVRNLKGGGKLNAAIRVIVPEMNKVVPFDLEVRIHLPQEDWDIKILSFVVEKGANAWNFDHKQFEETVIPAIESQLIPICSKQ